MHPSVHYSTVTYDRDMINKLEDKRQHEGKIFKNAYIWHYIEVTENVTLSKLTYLHSLVVDKESRHKGYGGKALGELKASLQPCGALALYVGLIQSEMKGLPIDAMEKILDDNVQFYLNHDFIIIDDTYKRDKFSVLMYYLNKEKE